MAKKKRKKAKPLPRGIDYSTVRGYRVRLSWRGYQHFLGYYDTFGRAKAARERFLDEMAAGTFVPPAELNRQTRQRIRQEQAQRVTVQQWFDEWIKSLETMVPPRSPNTILTYRNAIDPHVLDAVGHMYLTQVSPAQLQEPIDAQLRAGRYATANNMVTATKSMFTAAVEVEAGGLTISPALGLKAPKQSPKRSNDEVPTLEQLNAITSKMRAPYDLAAQLAALCALRIGEVLGLQRRDITNLDVPGQATLAVERQWLRAGGPYAPPKHDSYRTITIPPTLVPRLKAHLEGNVGPALRSPLFPSPQDPNRPVSDTSLAAAWREARKGINERAPFHSLRHLALTLFAQQGATTEELLHRGGHKSPQVAMRYQHATVARDRELTARMDAALQEGTK